MSNKRISRILGKSDIIISKLGLGTVQFGFDYGFSKKKSQDEVNSILDCAYNNNIIYLDTAREYGESEKMIGNFKSMTNSAFLISTKLQKINESFAKDKNLLQELIMKSIAVSKENLQIESIEMLMLHQSDEFLIENIEFWNIIEKLKKEHVIKTFGVSVYNIEETKYLINNHHQIIDFLQIPYNIFDRRFECIFEQAEKLSISLISRSTYLKGLLTCDINQVPIELSNLLVYKEKFINLCNQCNLTPQEFALLFVLKNPNLTSTIIGVNNIDELKQNIDIFSKFDIDIDCLKKAYEINIQDEFLLDPRKWRNF